MLLYLFLYMFANYFVFFSLRIHLLCLPEFISSFSFSYYPTRFLFTQVFFCDSLWHILNLRLFGALGWYIAETIPYGNKTLSRLVTNVHNRRASVMQLMKMDDRILMQILFEFYWK